MSVLVDIKCGDPTDAAARFQLAGYSVAYAAGSGHLIDFDPAGHVYKLRDTGEILPSVTQVLKATRISTDFDELGQMRKGLDHQIALKREIGTAVHQAAHFYDDNDLVWSSLDPQVVPYLEAWTAFRQAYSHLRPATRERIVYSAIYRFVGTLDAIFLANGETAINITERWSVQLTPGKKIPYRVTPYNEHPYLDDEKFKAFVVTYHEQADRRRAA
jgi:hypothetical protein